MEQSMKSHNLPQIDSIRELAQFWDNHDLTDYEDALEEVTEPVFQRDAAITLHLEPSEAEAIRQIAKSKGVAETDLVRQWVLENIQSV
jgi:hypothetical protein